MESVCMGDEMSRSFPLQMESSYKRTKMESQHKYKYASVKTMQYLNYTAINKYKTIKTTIRKQLVAIRGVGSIKP